MNNQYSPKRFPEKNQEAMATLERVSREWFANQEVVKWKVFEPMTKRSVCIWAFICAFGITLPWYDLIFNLFFQKKLNEIIIFLIIILLLLYIFWKGFQYNIESIKINRKKRKGIRTLGGGFMFMKYGGDYMLNTFRLPENDTDGAYAQMREKLQQAITAETGWTFYNNMSH